MKMSVLGTASAIAGAACLLCFLLPVLTGRIVNIGNVTGLLCSACLLFYGCRQAAVHGALRALWTGNTSAGAAGRAFLLAAAALAAAILLTAAVLTGMMVRAALLRPAPEAPVIVLGCEVKGERPSLMLEGRMDAAVRYLEAHPDVVCVVSGGKGEGEKISEAECMYRYMTARGIDPARILREDRSASTRENLLFSAEKLREAGLGGVREVAVVTNEFHACRARLIARSLGLTAGAVPARSPWWLLPTFYVRELYGLLYQIFC